MTYQLEGRLLEVCTCDVLCPCWVGEDPDGGICVGAVTYRIDKGQIGGVDVSGLTVTMLNHIPGNILKGNWRTVIYMDDKATPAQQKALEDAFTGQLGGPLKDVYQLVGEFLGVERAPVTFEVQEGKGAFKFGQAIEAELVPFQGATGQTTTLHDTVFTTIPGSPAYVGKAARYQVNVPQHRFKQIDLQNHNAIQGTFRFEG
jgi:hypothetical protein